MIRAPNPPRTPAGPPPGRPTGGATLATVVPLVTTGAIVGLLSIVLSLSLASLVFAGELSAYLPNGIGLALLSTAIVGTAVTLLGSVPGTAAFSQLAPGAILAVMAASTVDALPDGAAGITRFMSVIALIGVTTALAGAIFFVVGHFRLGRLVRYLPYPVVGGFIAGTGWLLLTGGIRVMSDVSPSATYPLDLAGPGVWVRWLPGLAFALLLLVVTRDARRPLAFPAVIAVAVAGFYALLAASGGSIEGWRDAGFLLGAFPDADLLAPWAASDLQYVEWSVVGRHAPGGATVIFVSLLAVLFNSTAIEQITARRADLDRELRAVGIGNLLAGSIGGTIGYHALSLTTLNLRLGAGTRITPLVSVAVVLLAILHGSHLLALVPTFVIGGVLAYLGLTFLVTWLHGARATLTRIEYVVVVLILGTIVVAGFLAGVGVGLLLTVLLFVVNYARVDAVRHELTGSSAHSRVTWNARDRAALDRGAQGVLVLQLQGFLFFGSANALVERVERRLASGAALEHLIIEFRHVDGMDSTASASFVTLARVAQRADFTLVLADLSPALARQLDRGGLSPTSATAPLVVATLDAALEWSERRRLETAERDPLEALADRLAAPEDEELDLHALLPHLERIEVDAGRRFIVQGDRADDLYLVASGAVTARLERPDGATLRLETMHGGNLVGEIGFYTGNPRGATVVADEPTVLYRLTVADLETLAARDPHLASAFHRLVARRLAARVTHLQGVVTALQR